MSDIGKAYLLSMCVLCKKNNVSDSFLTIIVYSLQNEMEEEIVFYATNTILN